MTTKNYELKLKLILSLPDREDAFFQLVYLFVDGPNQIREEIRKGWDFGVDWVYPNTKRLACIYNEKRSSKDRILASLVYDAIEDFQEEDAKDKLVALAVIYHSCIAAGLDPNEEFEKVASLSSAKTAAFLRDFINRSQKDKSKKAFMLSSLKNKDGETEIFPSWMAA